MAEVIESREALREFLALMEQVDTEYFCEERRVTEVADVAEGEHMLLHLMKAAIDIWVDNDASRPRFAPLASATLKWGGEGSDNPSHCAPLDPTRRYKITGRMQSEVYISFTVYTGKAEGDWNDGVVSAMNHTEFQVDDQGYFEIELLPSAKDGALHMEQGKPNCILARHYFEDEVCALANPALRCEIDIECLEAPGYPRPLGSKRLAEKLNTAMTFIRGQTLNRPMMDPSSVPSWFSLVPNELPQPEKWEPTEGGGAGAVDNAYCAGLVVLPPEQALIVEGSWPECVYANVMWWNRYQQGADYRYRSCSLNRTQMTPNKDGGFTFVVAQSDPGVDNWIDTEGHMVGTLYWRFLLPEGEIERPRCKVVALADVAAELT